MPRPLMAKNKKVLFYAAFDRDVLNEGEQIEVNGSTVTVGEVLDCGRSCERRYWWFYAA